MNEGGGEFEVEVEVDGFFVEGGLEGLVLVFGEGIEMELNDFEWMDVELELVLVVVGDGGEDRECR